MPRYKESDRIRVKEQTRRRLVQAATDEFARHGYTGANINRISLAAGFAKGTVYNYFPSKHDLMLSVIDSIAEQHYAYLARQVLPDDDPRVRLRSFYAAGFAFVTDHLASSRLLFAVIHSPHQELKEHMYRAYQPMFRLVADDIVTLGIDEGVFVDRNPAELAQLLMTIYLGTASHVSDEGNFYIDVRSVTELVLHGLQGPGG